MASCTIDGSTVLIDTDLLSAEVHTEGYVSGIKAQTLLDKTTGVRDLGHGLHIVDFLLEPLQDEPGCSLPYHHGDVTHGDIVKRYVELPQICTKARKLAFEVSEGDGWVAVRQWFRYTEATYGRRPGSLWEQTMVFQDDLRYFLSADRITSVNTVPQLTLRIDMPGHLKHDAGDSFERIYLSYGGTSPAAAFVEDFPPDARNLYRRNDSAIPDYMIRAYQVRQEGAEGPWLAGITLDPGIVSEAWCHQRGYVCFIEEIGGRPVAAGESFGAAYAVGWFDRIQDARATADEYRGVAGIELSGTEETGDRRWSLYR